METPKIKYDNCSAFHKTLDKKVDAYFESTKTSKTGDGEILTKAIIFLTVGIADYSLFIYYLFNGFILIPLVLNFFMGFIFAGIGFNIMHDASHKSFSKHPWVNSVMLLTLELMGACSVFWMIKHVLLHHSFVNIEELDDDIHASEFLIMGPEQIVKWFNKYIQKYWLPVLILYSFLYIYWVWTNDFKKYFSRKIHNYKIPKKEFTPKMHFLFWFSKANYLFWMIILPWVVGGFWLALVCYIVMAATTGIIIALVFQLAHVVEESKFTKSIDGKIPHSWAEQQVFETINFQTDSRVLRFYIGGLNHQIEHHLFPNISHVHYHKIQRLVKETCAEFGLPYTDLPLKKAIRSHFKKLKQLVEKTDKPKIALI